jgi:outer membrane protein OmpA-like peptidoglycan-associated protein
MFSRQLAAAALGVGLLAAAPALAESQYSTGQIVDFFAKSPDLGKERGICIGTIAECQPIEEATAGFDMLINFELDSSELTPQAMENLSEFAKALADKRLDAARFVVEGHTDASGAETYNLGLSERRARAVTAFLLEKGVSVEKVEAIGMGEKSPRVADPMDPANRRVEMRIRLQ